MKTDCQITLLGLYERVCNYFGERPHYESVRTRQIAHYLAVETTTATLTQIGQVIGGVRHSTVRGCDRCSYDMISRLIEPLRNGKIQDIKLRNDIETLTK
jgi:chromosomal replication initiation ATPase DnaA